MSYSDFIKTSLQEVSSIANNNFGKVSGITKDGDNNQVLTDTDLEIGKILVNKIKEQYPDFNIIDEEAGIVNNSSQFTWVIDPIDGTSNFANGIPTYGIMIGLLDSSTPIAGGVALPAFNEIYIAEKGQGSFLNDNKTYVSKETKLLNSLVAYGIDGHQENPNLTKDESEILGKIILAIRNLRSSNSVFDAAQVLKGNYGLSLNKTSKIWDNVALQILTEEAGGIYTDFFGKEIDYSNPLTKYDKNYTFCAGTPILHEEIQRIINSN